ncbi:hypothetical protein [Sphingobium boeckii]|uniref:Lipoprotein n=1 Tax=Sphingobium boeckii TaxID=1082345 RepID=A0A7W9EFL1_9SPHN|nr:hypothetical protein [Sphingobium boeckii]MBB5686135.1 hypothetical protein [Sphingobium boeckii]
MRFPALSLFASLMLLSACGGGDDANKASEKAIDTSALRVPLAEKLNEPAALQSAFALAFETPAIMIKDERYTFAPAGLYRVKEGLVLFSEGSGPDCHACSGLLAVHYLTETPEGMKVTKGWTDAIPGSEYGAPPQWTVRTDLMSAPVVQTVSNGMGQGITCSIARLTELLPDGPKLRADLVPLAYSDEGAIVDDTKPNTVDAAIAPADRDRDFVVKYKGSVTRDVIWSRQGEAFVAGKDAQGIPQC